MMNLSVAFTGTTIDLRKIETAPRHLTPQAIVTAFPTRLSEFGIAKCSLT